MSTRDETRRYRAKKKALGHCRDCRAKRVHKAGRCSRCYKKMYPVAKKYCKLWVADKRMRGLCPRCGQRKVTRGLKSCARCREEARIRDRLRPYVPKISKKTRTYRQVVLPALFKALRTPRQFWDIFEQLKMLPITKHSLTHSLQNLRREGKLAFGKGKLWCVVPKKE